MDLTWVGWIFVIDMLLSIPLWLWYAANGGKNKTGAECVASAVMIALYMWGFFAVGFVH